MLTPEQLLRIRAIIERYHHAFMVDAFGTSVVPEQVLEELKELGLLKGGADPVREAYLYGTALAASTRVDMAKMTPAQFEEYLRKNPVPLGPIELQAIEAAKQSAAQYCKGLGNRIDLATGAVLNEADAKLRAKMKKVIKKKVTQAVARRQSAQELKLTLGRATQDWARNLDRIAVTELQAAHLRGTADYYGKQYGGDVLVFRRAMAGACKHCIRLHVGPDGNPRIFPLSVLEENGSNVGRKAQDWLPVVGPIHPNCQCSMERVPPGFGFDEDGRLVPGGKGGVRYKGEKEMDEAVKAEEQLQKAFRIRGRINYQGLPIAIENPVGSIRKWRDESGNVGETRMFHAYGYIEGAIGSDNEELDVYVGPDPKAPMAFIVHQQFPSDQRYDEEKVMLGFHSEEEALRAYQSHYDRPDFPVFVSPIEVKHLVRLIEYTQESQAREIPLVIPKEPQKAKPSAYVVPLEKAQVGNAEHHSPSYGTGVNFFFPPPHRAEPTHPDMDTLREFVEPKDEPSLSQEELTSNREDVEFTVQNRFRHPHKLQPPTITDDEDDEDDDDHKKRKLLMKERG